MLRHRPLIAAIAVLAVLALPSVALASASNTPARKLAKRNFAVLRTAQRAGDRVPGLTGSHLLTRRVGRVDGRTVWLGLDGSRLCVWLRGDRGEHAESCSSVARALRPGTPIAIVYGGKGLTAAVALPDGASHARVQTRSGSGTPLRIRRNALVYATRAKGSRLFWQAPDGSERELPLRRP
jgi:hypothetical protein